MAPPRPGAPVRPRLRRLPSGPGYDLDHRGRPKRWPEPALLRAYADEFARRKLGVRSKVVAFGEVRESAEALKTGKADLAVIRPDVSMPGNGLTLAVLRELAAFVAAPGASEVKAVLDLGSVVA